MVFVVGMEIVRPEFGVKRAGPQISVVIPGRREATNPESSAVHNVWIPGLRQGAHPGMTI
jgi:hypothetical protein